VPDFTPPESIEAVFARRLRALRGDTKQVDLAAAMTDFGVPVASETISRLETGNRGFDLLMWLAAAHALSVPALALITDDDPDAPVLIGHTLVSSEQVWALATNGTLDPTAPERRPRHDPTQRLEQVEGDLAALTRRVEGQFGYTSTLDDFRARLRVLEQHAFGVAAEDYDGTGSYYDQEDTDQ
jgi:hypothetical protein